LFLVWDAKVREAVEKPHTRTSVAEFVGLVKNGDYVSLLILREKLGRSRAEVQGTFRSPKPDCPIGKKAGLSSLMDNWLPVA
jgi:hypothetical protein